MSRLDFCKYELVGDCYDWKNDNCDECNIFKAYCEGEIRAKNSIVRCKDCRHRYVTGVTTQYYVCDFMDAQYDDDGYCSHGERAEQTDKGGDAEVRNDTTHIIEPYMQQSRPHGRLIDADALADEERAYKKFLLDSYGGDFKSMPTEDQALCDSLDSFIADIINAPTVEVGRPHGEWLNAAALIVERINNGKWIVRADTIGGDTND